MRLGFNFFYYPGTGIRRQVELARLAENLGYHSVWTAEAYGSDAITPLAWMGAHTTRVALGTGILQISARTPAMTAMTAATLDALSGGRFVCGIGASGPQVVEGWHGVEYAKPLLKTREYVEILRAAWLREKPLEYRGQHYTIPYVGGTGLGKPLKSILHPRRDIPIYIAAIGPRNVEQTAEIADGILLFLVSPYRMEVFRSALEAGLARRPNRPAGNKEFDVVSSCTVVVTDDVERGLHIVKQGLALYFGGMGAETKNFYNQLLRRYGFEHEAQRIQELFLAGRREEAAANVPDPIADELSLVGSPERIRDRVAAWVEAGVTTLTVPGDERAMQVMAEVVG
jgi:F420-dependent oxidoreductase-like protein